MTIEMWPTSRPIPYARNPRKIPQAAIDKVAASIKEFGFRQPIVCDEQDVILVGHTRQLGAMKLGLAEVPVHVAAGLTPAQAKAYRLADNRTNQEAGWDLDLLTLELGDLRDLAFDISLTGFDESNSTTTPDASALRERFEILITCSSEQQQVVLLQRLDAEGYKCRALLS